jgi:predicted transcriptional regulator
MKTHISAKAAINKAGSRMALARLLGVSRQAVQQYEKSEIPPARLLQLIQLRPEWFKEKAK